MMGKRQIVEEVSDFGRSESVFSVSKQSLMIFFFFFEFVYVSGSSRSRGVILAIVLGVVAFVILCLFGAYAAYTRVSKTRASM